MTTAGRSPARTVPVVLASVLTAAAATLLVTPAPASAHDVLRSTDPLDGAVVDHLPDRVVLTFDEPALAIGTEVVVTGPAGPVSDGPPQLVDAEVRQPVRAGPAGRYTVLWRVTSADSHPVSGTFAFTTRQAGTASPTSTTGTTAPSSPAASSVSTASSVPSASSASSAASAAVTSAAATPQAAGPPGTVVVVVVVVVLALLALLALGWWAFRRRRAERP
jgi:methionine-rich copper-binding protein CopC